MAKKPKTAKEKYQDRLKKKDKKLQIIKRAEKKRKEILLRKFTYPLMCESGDQFETIWGICKSYSHFMSLSFEYEKNYQKVKEEKRKEILFRKFPYTIYFDTDPDFEYYLDTEFNFDFAKLPSYTAYRRIKESANKAFRKYLLERKFPTLYQKQKQTNLMQERISELDRKTILFRKF